MSAFTCPRCEVRQFTPYGDNDATKEAPLEEIEAMRETITRQHSKLYKKLRKRLKRELG